jgi:hypothetical protein
MSAKAVDRARARIRLPIMEVVMRVLYCARQFEPLLGVRPVETLNSAASPRR